MWGVEWVEGVPGVMVLLSAAAQRRTAWLSSSSSSSGDWGRGEGSLFVVLSYLTLVFWIFLFLCIFYCVLSKSVLNPSYSVICSFLSV